MKKSIVFFAILSLSLATAKAGDYYSKAPVAPGPIVTPPPVCPCFDAGAELSLFGSGLFSGNGGDFSDQDELGGGAGLGLFFNENLGINVSYHAFNTDPSVEHFGTADLVLRFPIQELCIAPYVFGGGGVVTNGTTDGLYRAGGGIDIRFDSMGCVGLFVDGSYNWVEGDDHADAAIARIGFKIPF